MTMREKLLEAIVYFTRYLRAQAACTAFRVYQHGNWSLPLDASASYLWNSCHLVQVFIERAQCRVDKVRCGTLAAQRQRTTKPNCPLTLPSIDANAGFAQWSEPKSLSASQLASSYWSRMHRVFVKKRKKIGTCALQINQEGRTWLGF